MDFKFEQSERKSEIKKKLRSFLLGLLRWTVELALVIGLAYILVNHAVERMTVYGVSMEPLIMDGDSILINKLSYLRGEPERFDVIVFKQSGDEHGFYYVRRVIGLPGERIQILYGRIYINGILLTEPMTTEPILVAGFAQEPFVLDEDEYFVLGDNRNDSEDSRFANIGNVVRDAVVGKAWIRFDEFGFLNE